MMDKGKALGLEFLDAVWVRYGTVPAKLALDTLHESWTPLWGFPKSRPIQSGSLLGNSVLIRTEESGYRPRNLQFSGGVPSGYGIETVVAEPATST
jgi:hypothetical protein